MGYVTVLPAAAACGNGQAKLPRFPDLDGDGDVLTEAGKLWTADPGRTK